MNYQPGAIQSRILAWTEEEADAVKKLWDEGASGDDIGKALGRTRCAILGLVHRRGWQRRLGGHRVTNVVREYPSRPGPKPPPKPTVAKDIKLPIAAKAPIIPEPPALFKSLIALGDRECRFAMNDGGPYLFCGQPTAERVPYCPFHHHKTTRIVEAA